MTDIIIKEEIGYIIKLNNSKNVFNVILKMDVEYSEEGFEEFLLYFTNTWEYIKTNNFHYHLLINLGSSAKKENELPLVAYVKLIKMMTSINTTLNNHCHSICILTEGSKKWKTAYEFATKLWKPDRQRPLKFTEDINEVTLFFNSHKLILTEDSHWVSCEDGGFVRSRTK